MLLTLETDLDACNTQHTTFKLRFHAQHCLAIHRRSCPIVRAADDALHAALGTRHDEAGGWASGEEERCCHISYYLLANTNENTCKRVLTGVYKSEESLLARASIFTSLDQFLDLGVRCGVIGHALIVLVSVMP